MRDLEIELARLVERLRADLEQKNDERAERRERARDERDWRQGVTDTLVEIKALLVERRGVPRKDDTDRAIGAAVRAAVKSPKFWAAIAAILGLWHVARSFIPATAMLRPPAAVTVKADAVGQPPPAVTVKADAKPAGHLSDSN